MEKKNEECCPEFFPESWDNKEFFWDNKPFIKDSVFTFFYMPVNFATIIKRMMKKVESGNVETPDSLCLSDHTSKWNMDLYLAVNKEVSDANNVTLNGKYFSKVYEGNYNKTNI